jgi:hypothetical protein
MDSRVIIAFDLCTYLSEMMDLNMNIYEYTSPRLSLCSEVGDKEYM